MARRNLWDGGEIDNLPSEILSFNIKETPRPTLKDIANRLNADSISAGNWESLAEKLGFIQNSILDNLTQQAKVQNTFPGLLMLNEWSLRAGSTAHVLLHALREIQREDVVAILVEKLFELHTMPLLVSIHEGESPPKYLRVPTQKNAPLHASLDNMLNKPPYWYDIVGPRHDITWNTPSGVLQGCQLTLQLRMEPNKNSMTDIYGTTASVCTPPPPQNQLELNIQPGQSDSIGTDQSQLNDLSNHLPAPLGMNISQSPTGQLQFVHRPGPQPTQSLATALDDFEPLTSHASSESEAVVRFPILNSLSSPSPSDFQFPLSSIEVPNVQSSTHGVEYRPCSYTETKKPLVAEDEETLTKSRATMPHESMAVCAVEHDEMAFTEGVQFANTNKSPTNASSSSSMHTDYVAHDRLIEFCNNPSSPQSLESDPLSYGSPVATEIKTTSLTKSESGDCACAQLQTRSPAVHRKIANTGEYVPVTFIEKQSQNFRSGASTFSVEEEFMQTEQSSFGTDNVEGMEVGDSHFSQAESCTYPKLSTSVTTAASLNSKPKPCTYTMYRPGTVNNSHQYSDFDPHPLPYSVSLESGYLDMRGVHNTGTPHQDPVSTSARMTGLHTCRSVDSYMNTCVPDLPLQNASASHFLSSTPPNDHQSNHSRFLHHSRNRRPLPVGQDVFPPRDRRPFTPDHDRLFDETEPNYTYIEAVSPTNNLPRRSSEGALPAPEASPQGSMSSTHANRKQRSYRGSASSAELHQLPGWNPYITERTVDHEMSRYINDDGNFIVWYYTVGRKYVISVSHLRSIRHYAVYESEREGKSHFYIFPKGPRFKSLSDLVRYCQTKGVMEPIKTFKAPDGSRHTHQNSGRFSHVRLRNAIAARHH